MDERFTRICKNCGMKHPIGEVSGIKANMRVNPPCKNYKGKEAEKHAI